MNDLLHSLRYEAAYREIAHYFRVFVVPSYAVLIREAEVQKPDLEIVRSRLGQIENTLNAQLSAYPLAGLFNHVGNLAMTRGAPNLALGRFYSGLALDPEHVPLYESIAYASWAINQEALTALKYAATGLELSLGFADRLEAEYQETTKNYAALQGQHPTLVPRLEARSHLVKQRFSFVEGKSRSFMASMRDRLELLFSYCSALELINEDRARVYARRLFESDRDDGEYQDALGLVLLRFAKDKTEIDEAEGLFKAAYDNRKSEELTRQLAALHLGELDRKRRTLRLSRN